MTGSDSVVAEPMRYPTCLLVLVFAGCLIADDLVLPDGKGRDVVESVCTDCHTVDRIMRQNLTADQWRRQVRIMVENGASLTPDDLEPLIAYLTRHFGPKVNVNKDSAQDLAAGLQLSKAEAEAMVAYRAASGPFKDLGDLQKVPGLDTTKLAGEEKRIGF